MRRLAVRTTFWLWWLHAVTLGVMFCGLVLVFAPALSRQGFSFLIYADAEHITAFGADAVAYIELVHAVLGAVMFGWAVALLFVVRGMFTRGTSEGWRITTVSVAAWFIPDTGFSLYSGFCLNAVLNVVFIFLFAVPIVATYRAFHETRS